MRVGKGIHPDGVPGWCQGFSLDGGSGVRAVKVIQHGNRPGLIYNIGTVAPVQQQCRLAAGISSPSLTSLIRSPLLPRNQRAERERTLPRHSHRDLCPSLPPGQPLHTPTGFCPERICKRKGTKEIELIQHQIKVSGSSFKLASLAGLSGVDLVTDPHHVSRPRPTRRATSPPCRAPAWSSTGPAATTTSCCACASWTTSTAPGPEASKSINQSPSTST